MEIREVSLENVFKSRNETVEKAKKNGKGNGKKDETKNLKEKKKEKSLCVCRCDLCVFENSPEEYLNSFTEHSSEHPTEHSTEDFKERSLELEPRFRVLGDQYMQQGRVTVAISLYTAAILDIQIKLKKIFNGEQIMLSKKSKNLLVKKNMEGNDDENENKNGRKKENKSEYVILERKNTDAKVETGNEEKDKDKEEEEEEKEEEEENVVSIIDGLSSLYYSLGAAVLDCKHTLSLSLPTPCSSFHPLSFPSIPLPLPAPTNSLVSSSLPSPTPFLHTLPLPTPAPLPVFVPLSAPVSSSTPTLTLTPYPVSSLYGSSSNWRKGHEIWKIGDQITKKWYKLHEKTQIKKGDSRYDYNDNKNEGREDISTKYRNSLTMQIEKLNAYDYLNLPNGSYTGGMDGGEMQGAGGRRGVGGEGEGGRRGVGGGGGEGEGEGEGGVGGGGRRGVGGGGVVGGGGGGVVGGGGGVVGGGGEGEGGGVGGREEDKKKDKDKEDRDKMTVRNKDENESMKSQSQDQDQDERLKGLNIHISRGLISEMECERAIQWAEDYAAALPLPLSLPLTLPLTSSSISLLPSIPPSFVLPSSFADIHKEKTTTIVSNPASSSPSTQPSSHPSHSHPPSTLTPPSSSSNGWTTTRHYAVPTTDLPIHIIPPFLHWFNSVMQNRVAPLLRKQFLNGFGRVSVHDAFIVKYEHNQSNSFPSSSSTSSFSSFPSSPSSSTFPPSSSSSTSSSSTLSSSPFIPQSSSTTNKSHEELGSNHGIKPSLAPSIFNCLSHPLSSSQRHLPLHTDESTHSLIIALNSKERYLGGGTFFADLNSTVRPGAHMYVCVCVCVSVCV